MPYLYLLLGLGGLLLGAELAVRGSLGIAKCWGWPSWLTGLVLVATGTSLPELFLSVSAAGSHPTLALGNVFGSNAFNAAAVLGVMLLSQRSGAFPFSGISLATAGPLFVGSAAAFDFFGGADAPSYAAPLLFAAYGVMLFASIFGSDRSEWESQKESLAAGEKPVGERPFWFFVLLTLAGFGGMAFAAEWFLNGALSIAEEFGWSEGFAGYLITAVGTSAPELATSYRAVRHGHPEAVLGNLIGSNAFNLFLAGGAVCLLQGSPIDAAVVEPQLWVNLASTMVLILPGILLFTAGSRSLRIPRWAGLLLVGGYVYAAWLVQGGA